RAGCGQGKDAAPLDALERARWRTKALDWLRAELAAWRQQLTDDLDGSRATVRQRMQYWQHDPDFAGVREKDGLGSLPKVERLEWQRFGEDVAALLNSAAGRQ